MICIPCSTLQKLRKELFEYGQTEALWLKSQASFLRTMYHDEKYGGFFSEFIYILIQ